MILTVKHGASMCILTQWNKCFQSVGTVSEIIGKPKVIRFYNCPEFLSNALTQYCHLKKITIKYIQPRKPTQNAYIERFNRSYREDILDAYLFEDISQLRELSWQ